MFLKPWAYEPTKSSWSIFFFRRWSLTNPFISQDQSNWESGGNVLQDLTLRDSEKDVGRFKSMVEIVECNLRLVF